MMKIRYLLILAVFSLAFTACEVGSSAGDDTGRTGLVDNECVTDNDGGAVNTAPEFPLKFGNAENVLFTDTGRIFVTGENVAEITGEGLVRLIPEGYASVFAGMAQVDHWLYVVCGKNYETTPPLDLAELLTADDIMDKLVFFTDLMMEKVILRADLDAGGPDKLVFTVIHHLQGMMIPNGMAADAQGNLYIADETFLPKGQIVKVTVSDDQVPVTTQEVWLSGDDGVCSPNGMCIRDSMLYFTDFNINSGKPAQVKKVEINADGTPGEVFTIYSAMGLFDDLDAVIYNGKPVVAVASFFGGSILIIDESTGEVSKAGGGALQSPSSAHFGNGGWIGKDELIVTEVGMLYEPDSNFGNRVRVIAVP